MLVSAYVGQLEELLCTPVRAGAAGHCGPRTRAAAGGCSQPDAPRQQRVVVFVCGSGLGPVPRVSRHVEAGGDRGSCEWKPRHAGINIHSLGKVNAHMRQQPTRPWARYKPACLRISKHINFTSQQTAAVHLRNNAKRDLASRKSFCSAPVQAGEKLAQHLGGVVHVGQPKAAARQRPQRLPQLRRRHRPATLQRWCNRVVSLISDAAHTCALTRAGEHRKPMVAQQASVETCLAVCAGDMQAGS